MIHRPVSMAGMTRISSTRSDQEWRDETSFPLRFRLNMWAEVVPDLVDFYSRLTMNKRWGAWDSSVSSSSDPFNKPNSFEASIGHDVTLRVEQAYATFKIPRSTLPGMSGDSAGIGWSAIASGRKSLPQALYRL